MRSGGLLNAWSAFEGAAAEIAGESAQYYAAGWVVAETGNQWRQPTGRGFRRIDPEEEADEGTPLAQTLAKYKETVSIIAHAPDHETDPSVLRTQILERRRTAEKRTD